RPSSCPRGRPPTRSAGRSSPPWRQHITGLPCRSANTIGEKTIFLAPRHEPPLRPDIRRRRPQDPLPGSRERRHRSIAARSTNMSELVLVSHHLCPYVQRAAIALIEKSVPFQR